MTQPDSDKLDELYQLGATERPPEDLDASILAIARQQAELNAELQAPFPKALLNVSWYRLGGVAAVVLLSSSLVVNLYLDAPDQMMIEQAPLLPPATYQSMPEEQLDSDITSDQEVIEFESSIEEQTKKAEASALKLDAQRQERQKRKLQQESLQKQKSLRLLDGEMKAPATMRMQSPVMSKLAPAAMSPVGPKVESITGNSAASASEEILDAETWLLKIDRLMSEGRIKEAKDALEAFKTRYPDYSLDEKYIEIENIEGE